MTKLTRYSESFKQAILQKIVSGELTVSQAKRRYNIRGGSTIPGWLRKYDHQDKLPTIKYITSVSEMDRLKQLEKEKQELESALAQAHMRNVYLESLLTIAEEEYGLPLKKNADKGHLLRSQKK